MWVYFRPRSRQNERSHLQNIATHLVNFTENVEWLKQHCDTEVITPLPGNILCRHSLMYVLALTCQTISIQPPCMMHAVYTPIASFATGGHFYHYGCMHLTELARYIDIEVADSTTNQTLVHALETIRCMVIAIPYLSRHISMPFILHRAHGTDNIIRVVYQIITQSMHHGDQSDSVSRQGKQSTICTEHRNCTAKH
jgi:hypothetical protein